MSDITWDELEQKLDEARKEGYTDGVSDTENELGCAAEDAFDEGVEKGMQRMDDTLAERLCNEFRDALFNPLEDIAVRWDAAERCLVWTQGKRSVTFR